MYLNSKIHFNLHQISQWLPSDCSSTTPGHLTPPRVHPSHLYSVAGEEIGRPCALNVISIRVTLAAAKNDIVWDRFGNGGNIIRE